MDVVKSGGDIVKFDPEKLRNTLRHIHAKPETIEHIVQKVTKQAFDGITTRELFSIVRRELIRENHCLAHRYNLRNGLLKLGPAGFKFEKYVAAILNAYQYKAEVPEKEFNGLCVRHEIDVLAEKDERVAVIEAKFRNRFDDVVTLKDTMATWSRFVDLVDGGKAGSCPRVDEIWIVTNGRFSDRAHQFGMCKGIHLVGWSSEENSLARMVDHAALYPITVLDDVRQWELDRFAEKNLMLCREVADKTPAAIAKMIDVSEERAEKIIKDAAEVITL